MSPTEFAALKTLTAKGSNLTVSESFTLARECSRLLANSGEDEARDLVIRTLENFARFPEPTRPLWRDLVEAVGLYPYLRSPELDNSATSSAKSATGALTTTTIGTPALVRYEYHASEHLNGVYLHREQLHVSHLLLQGKSVILSAPTSFGKSLLIQEVVASKRYRNIVVVQPTLALLDETRKKLQRYEDTYQLVVSTTQPPSEAGNIFLFTGERVVDYPSFPSVDFFVIDEFYKLSLARDDERAVTLNHALYRLLKHTNTFYLLGPSIRSVSSELAESTGATWIRSDYATVAVDVTTVNGLSPARRRGTGETPKAQKVSRLLQLLATLKDPTLVYCASPAKATDLSVAYLESAIPKKSRRLSEDVRELVEWIDENIHPKWALRTLLTHGVAFHHGALPRHLASSLVDAFNSSSIKVLFCTSTLIEGVNTTARNVVLFDEAKGKKPIDYFDYKNIIGRSGRMKIHYVGRVFQLVRSPTQTELDVDVPLFQQATAPIELLVQMESADLGAVARDRLERLPAHGDEDLLAILRKNAGVSVEGQLKVFDEINNNIHHYDELLRWTTIPKYRELLTAIELIWRFLLKPGESKVGVSDRQLAFMALQYVHNRSLKSLIDQMVNGQFWREREPNEDRRVQQVVHLVLNTARQWFEYKLPRLLSAVSSLQELAFTRHDLRPGNYAFFAGQLETSFVGGALAMLLDRDVPLSAIRKIEPYLGQPESWADIVERLRDVNLHQISLLPYEARKLRAAISMSS